MFCLFGVVLYHIVCKKQRSSHLFPCPWLWGDVPGLTLVFLMLRKSADRIPESAGRIAESADRVADSADRVESVLRRKLSGLKYNYVCYSLINNVLRLRWNPVLWNVFQDAELYCRCDGTDLGCKNVRE